MMLRAVWLLSWLGSAAAWKPGRVATSSSRRAVLGGLAPLALALPASAFENRLPPDEFELKYKPPRTPGPKPTAIGPRAGGLLTPCTDGKPHCFSTTPEESDDAELQR